MNIYIYVYIYSVAGVCHHKGSVIRNFAISFSWNKTSSWPSTPVIWDDMALIRRHCNNFIAGPQIAIITLTPINFAQIFIFCNAKSTVIMDKPLWRNISFSNSYYELIAQALGLKLLLAGFHKTPLMISQHWFGWWLATVRQQALN